MAGTGDSPRTPHTDPDTDPNPDGDPNPDADSDPASGPLAPVAARLTSIPVTLAFGTLLAAVFLVELWVWETLGFDAFAFLFVADGRPSPAWLLAPFAHTPLRPYHLVFNLAVLVVFGGLAERRLPRQRYVAFLLVAGLASTFGQLGANAITGAGADSLGTLGASGIVLAATAYVVVEGVRTRLAAGAWRGDGTAGFVLAGALALAVQLATDFGTASPGVGRYGHLWGVLFGAGVALFQRVDTDADAGE